MLRKQSFARFAPRVRWLLQVWRLPGDILYDTYIICAALLKRLGGRRSFSRTLAVSFKAGGADEQAAARRALAVGLTTISPNTIVITIDEQKDLMLIHQMKASGASALMKELGAE